MVAAGRISTEEAERRLEEVEEQYLRNALKAAEGNRSEAARRLGITRVTLRAKIRRYGLA